NKRSSSGNILTNILGNGNARNRQDGDRSASGVYGFLNYRNSAMLTEARSQFRAVWGPRALVDDWRRIEAVRNQVADNATGRTGQSDLATGQVNQNDRLVPMDIGEVPFTGEEKQQLKAELANAKYELGNLFLLTLQIPDSASRYFRSIVEDHAGHDLVPKALYSLFELYRSAGSPDRAERWGRHLLEDYPGTIYARRAGRWMGVERAEAEPAPSDSRELKKEARQLMARADRPSVELAERLRALALQNREWPAAAHIHHEAIRQYIELAKEHHSPLLAHRVADTDSSIAVGSGRYEGAYWDSTRAVVEEYKAHFAGTLNAPDIKGISEVLGEAGHRGDEIRSCGELGISPRIKSGMDRFLSAVAIPAALDKSSRPDEIAFEFILAPDGTILSYHPGARNTTLGDGIEEAFESAISEQLEFLPLEVSESVDRIRCRVAFPLK
ncbi:MAG: hypothetical protein R3224_05995, partial [Balneolaceae bacterium]|nr:hypothetical protein [Balneolaceae bacterium]